MHWMTWRTICDRPSLVEFFDAAQSSTGLCYSRPAAEESCVGEKVGPYARCYLFSSS